MYTKRRNMYTNTSTESLSLAVDHKSVAHVTQLSFQYFLDNFPNQICLFPSNRNAKARRSVDLVSKYVVFRFASHITPHTQSGYIKLTILSKFMDPDCWGGVHKFVDLLKIEKSDRLSRLVYLEQVMLGRARELRSIL